MFSFRAPIARRRPHTTLIECTLICRPTFARVARGINSKSRILLVILTVQYGRVQVSKHPRFPTTPAATTIRLRLSVVFQSCIGALRLGSVKHFQFVAEQLLV